MGMQTRSQFALKLRPIRSSSDIDDQHDFRSVLIGGCLRAEFAAQGGQQPLAGVPELYFDKVGRLARSHDADIGVGTRHTEVHFAIDLNRLRSELVLDNVLKATKVAAEFFHEKPQL